MNPHKKHIELTGSLIYPIEVGEAAFICEADGMRRTSTVLRTKKVSAQEICFETVNSNYRLHLAKQGLSVQAVNVSMQRGGDAI